MSTNFIPVGAGWFLFEDETNRKCIICDALAGEPNRIFGPAAWNGAPGPLSGKTILEACALVNGSWQQTGPDAWAWHSEAGVEQIEEPSSWPRCLSIKDDAVVTLFNEDKGRIFFNIGELVAFLMERAAAQPVRELPCSTENERLGLAVAMFASGRGTFH